MDNLRLLTTSSFPLTFWCQLSSWFPHFLSFLPFSFYCILSNFIPNLPSLPGIRCKMTIAWVPVYWKIHNECFRKGCLPAALSSSPIHINQNHRVLIDNDESLSAVNFARFNYREWKQWHLGAVIWSLLILTIGSSARYRNSSLRTWTWLVRAETNLHIDGEKYSSIVTPCARRLTLPMRYVIFGTHATIMIFQMILQAAGYIKVAKCYWEEIKARHERQPSGVSLVERSAEWSRYLQTLSW